MSGVHTAAVFLFLALAVSGATIQQTRHLLRSPCPEGSFVKKHNNECMVCADVENCVGGCADEEGCLGCDVGYFTSRNDDSWPFACKKCTIENCVKCRQKIYDAWPEQCNECAPGYVPGRDRKSCDPDGSLKGVEEAKTAVIEETAPATEVGGVEIVIQAGAGRKDAPEVEEAPIPEVEETPTPEVEEAPIPEVEPTPTPEVEEAPIPEVEPTPTPEVEPTPTCTEGQFYKKKDNSCMDCDANCVEGRCTDDTGCDQCKPGYFKSAADPFWPFECKKCTIENCAECEDDVFDAWPQFCTKCVDGFEVTDRTSCSPISVPTDGGEPVNPEPVVEETPEPVVEEVPEPVVEETPEPVVEEVPEPVVEETPEPVVEEVPEPIVEETPEPVVESASVCPEGQFFKKKDDSCMDCDKNCVEGRCSNDTGCDQCKPGYFRSAADPFWPFECKKCTIENCAECEDGVFDAWPKFCTKCVDGFEVKDRTTCTPIAVPEEPVATPEEPVPTPEEPVPTPEEPVATPEEPAPTPEEPVNVGGADTCPDGYFKDKKDKCKKCDENCAEGSCIDRMGCKQCKPGTNTFRSREDPFWPYSCVSCTIKDCLQCVDGGFNREQMRCAVCGNGTSRYNGGTECV